MSDPVQDARRDWALDHLLSFPCTQCNAEIGDPCTSKSGKRIANVHLSRRKAWVKKPAGIDPRVLVWRSIACPFCGAPAGEDCHRGPDEVPRSPHQARRRFVEGARHEQRLQVCPKCGALPGAACVNARGAETATHDARKNL